MGLYSQLSISRSCGDYFYKFKLPEVQINLHFGSSNYPKCKLICTSGNLDLLKSPQRQSMDGESNQNAFLNQKDASSFAESEISEFEISRFDCSLEPAETPSSASHQAPSYVQRS